MLLITYITLNIVKTNKRSRFCWTTKIIMSCTYLLEFYQSILFIKNSLKLEAQSLFIGWVGGEGVCFYLHLWSMWIHSQSLTVVLVSWNIQRGTIFVQFICSNLISPLCWWGVLLNLGNQTATKQCFLIILQNSIVAVKFRRVVLIFVFFCLSIDFTALKSTLSISAFVGTFIIALRPCLCHLKHR